jgi:hypothetical protein
MKLLIYAVIIAVSMLSTWFVGFRMQRHIKKVLGTKAESEIQLTSLNTWMRVRDAEEHNRGGRIS